VTEQLAGAIAAGRALSVEQVTSLLSRGPFLAQQALAEGLVDGLMYRDEVYDQARKEAGPDATLLYLQRYQRTQSLSDLPRRLGSSVQGIAPGQHERFVATIYAHGAIRHGRSGRGGPGGGGMGSDTVAAALRAAGADDGARAVVLRVNSPGGSYTASDVIWREVVKLRAAGKPVVVSMGDVAASGGYFISAPADVIVAQPGTITGSIGVFMGKPVLRELFGRAGVTTDSITDAAGAASATMFSSSRPFSETEWARINEWLDMVYADFTEKVASGRRMPAERVHELARGRVWTGADAIANGLADEAGGLREAVAIARKRAGLPADAPVRIYPRLSPFDQLRPAESSEAKPAARAQLGMGALGAGTVGAGALGMGALAALFADGWGPAWRFAAAAGLPPYGPLTLPGVWTIS
jgi:protease-4